MQGTGSSFPQSHEANNTECQGPKHPEQKSLKHNLTLLESDILLKQEAKLNKEG